MTSNRKSNGRRRRRRGRRRRRATTTTTTTKTTTTVTVPTTCNRKKERKRKKKKPCHIGVHMQTTRMPLCPDLEILDRQQLLLEQVVQAERTVLAQGHEQVGDWGHGTSDDSPRVEAQQPFGRHGSQAEAEVRVPDAPRSVLTEPHVAVDAPLLGRLVILGLFSLTSVLVIQVN